MTQVADIFIFNNEMEMLDIRVKTLEDVVDKFFIIEAPMTFQGDGKKCLASSYSHPKVVVCTLPILIGDNTWAREEYQRNADVDLQGNGIKDDALLLSGDVDEVPRPEIIAELTHDFDRSTVYVLMQKMHFFYLNTRVLGQDWPGTRACSVEAYRRLTAHGLWKRRQIGVTISDAGWHWSFLGSREMTEQKVRAYSHEEHNREKNMFSAMREVVDNGESTHQFGYVIETVSIDSTFPKHIVLNEHILRQRGLVR